MSDRYFFDTSAFLAVIKKEPYAEIILDLRDSLKRFQCVTSVLVAYELYRGIPPSATKRKAQIQVIETSLKKFTLKPVYEAHAMTAARLYQYSKGTIDPLLAAQCVDGDYILVTTNRKDFERVPGLRIVQL